MATHQPDSKNTAIMTTILPAALYGTEVGKGSNRAMQALRTAIADTVGPNSARRCLAMVFSYNNQKADLDPNIQQVVRKVALLRRITAKYPKLTTIAKAAICAFTQQGKAGTTTTLTTDQPNQLHPGPIGHLLTSLHHIGIQMDYDFNLTYQPCNQTNNKTTQTHNSQHH